MEQLSHQNLVETDSTESQQDNVKKDSTPDPEPFKGDFTDENKTIENSQPEVENVENQTHQVVKSIVEDFAEFNGENKESMLAINDVDRKITRGKTRKSVLVAFDPLYVPSPVVTAQKGLVIPIIEEPSTSDETANNTSFTEDKLAQIQLNAAQQACASLELELRQKEEVYIKSQVEWSRNEEMY